MMFVADLHGKLSVREEASEDFLTSSVFSVLNYLGEEYLTDFLQQSINLQQKKLDVSLCGAKIEYWPWWPNSSKYGGGAEPDVVIYNQNTAIIIEAKNYSGKSGIGLMDCDQGEADDPKVIVDQLGREYFAARKNLQSKNIQKDGKDFKIEKILIIYLTRHFTLPEKDILESIEAIKYKNGIEDASEVPEIYWLNWQQVVPVLNRIISSSGKESFASKISTDLVNFLEKRDIKPSFDYSFLEKSLDIIDARVSIEKAGSIFYPEQIVNYWEQIGSQIGLDNDEFYLFYKQTICAYWDSGTSVTPIKPAENVFYKERE